MNQIVKNVESLLDKYEKHIDTESKLVLLYLREFEQVQFDSRYIATSDFLNIDMELVQAIIDAKYMLGLVRGDES